MLERLFHILKDRFLESHGESLKGLVQPLNIVQALQQRGRIYIGENDLLLKEYGDDYFFVLEDDILIMQHDFYTDGKLTKTTYVKVASKI